MALLAHSEMRKQRKSGFAFIHTKSVSRILHHGASHPLIVTGYDIYRPEINDDLQRFYDYYCKNVQNRWEEETPPLRLSLLGFEKDGSNAQTVIERPENEWPIAREKQMNLYLDASGKTLSTKYVSKVSSVSYDGHSLNSSAVSLGEPKSPADRY